MCSFVPCVPPAPSMPTCFLQGAVSNRGKKASPSHTWLVGPCRGLASCPRAGVASAGDSQPSGARGDPAGTGPGQFCKP